MLSAEQKQTAFEFPPCQNHPGTMDVAAGKPPGIECVNRQNTYFFLGTATDRSLST